MFHVHFYRICFFPHQILFLLLSGYSEHSTLGQMWSDACLVNIGWQFVVARNCARNWAMWVLALVMVTVDNQLIARHFDLQNGKRNLLAIVFLPIGSEFSFFLAFRLFSFFKIKISLPIGKPKLQFQIRQWVSC